MTVQVSAVPGDEALDELEGEWDRLFARAGVSNFFQTASWIRSWHEVLEPNAALTVLTARDDDGTLLGLLALSELQRRVHRRVPVPLRYLGLAGSGAGAGDHLGPICETGGDVEHALVAAAIETGSGRTLLFESVAEQHEPALLRIDGATVVDRIRCPAFQLSDDIEGRWSKKMRENVRRRARQLEGLGVKPRWVSPGPAVADGLSSLQELHASRWDGRGGGLFDELRLRFLSDVARRATGPDGPWLLLMEKDGEAIAGLLGFRHRTTFASYKTGWNPEFARYGIGIALTVTALDWARSEGLSSLDLLRGSEPHKYALGATDAVDFALLRPVGPSGRLLAMREEASSRRAGQGSGRGVDASEAAPAGEGAG